jgi:hypothetical protein
VAAFTKCTRVFPSCMSRTRTSSPMAPRTLWPTWPPVCVRTHTGRHRRAFPNKWPYTRTDPEKRHSGPLGPRVRGAFHLQRSQDATSRHRPPGGVSSGRTQPLQTGPCPCSGRRSRLPGLAICGNGILLDPVHPHRSFQLVLTAFHSVLFGETRKKPFDKQTDFHII